MECKGSDKSTALKEIRDGFKFITGFAGGTLLLATNFVANANIMNMAYCIRFYFCISTVITYISLAISIIISLIIIRRSINNQLKEEETEFNAACSFILSLVFLSIGFLSFLASIVFYILQ